MLPGVAAQAEIFIVLTWGSLYLKSIPDIKQIPEDTERQTSQMSAGSVGRDTIRLTFHVETKLQRRRGCEIPQTRLNKLFTSCVWGAINYSDNGEVLIPGRVQDTEWGRRPTQMLGKQSEDSHPSFALAEVTAAD